MTEKRFTMVVTGSDGSFHYWDKFTDERITSTLELENKLNALNDENEQLKQRNNRQAKQLDRLYRLIEEKDWRTLNDILDDFKQCEEQLQRESGTYGDFE